MGSTCSIDNRWSVSGNVDCHEEYYDRFIGSCGIFLNHQIAEMILAKRNFKTIDKSLLEFLNQLGNFSAIQGEITNVLHQTAQYTPPILAEAWKDATSKHRPQVMFLQH